MVYVGIIILVIIIVVIFIIGILIADQCRGNANSCPGTQTYTSTSLKYSKDSQWQLLRESKMNSPNHKELLTMRWEVRDSTMPVASGISELSELCSDLCMAS